MEQYMFDFLIDVFCEYLSTDEYDEKVNKKIRTRSVCGTPTSTPTKLHMSKSKSERILKIYKPSTSKVKIKRSLEE